jgi:hypothetical protein
MPSPSEEIPVAAQSRQNRDPNFDADNRPSRSHAWAAIGERPRII